MCNFIAIPITLRAVHLHYFCKLAIKKIGFDIKLLEDEPIRSNDGEEKAQGIKTTTRANISS
jgi:hypothetical protein